MFLLNNKPYLDLDNLLAPQLEELHKLKKKIALGIARTQAKKSLIDDYKNWTAFIYEKEFDGMKCYEKIANFNPPDDPDTKDLSVRERELFYKMYYGLYPPISYLSIKDIRAWAPLGEDTDYLNFGFLQEWADTLPFVRKDVVRLMIQEPGQKVLLHTDFSKETSAKYKKSGEFFPNKEAIYINIFTSKKFYLYDEDTDQRHYVNSLSSVWHLGNWHGVESSEIPCWSMMIHGEYTEEFREKVKCL